jgi:hypothetical protein
MDDGHSSCRDGRWSVEERGERRGLPGSMQPACSQRAANVTFWKLFCGGIGQRQRRRLARVTPVEGAKH